jgi:hypothetical protein
MCPTATDATVFILSQEYDELRQNSASTSPPGLRLPAMRTVFSGLLGTGKTQVAIGLAIRVCQAGHRRCSPPASRGVGQSFASAVNFHLPPAASSRLPFNTASPRTQLAHDRFNAALCCLHNPEIILAVVCFLTL